MSQTNWENVLLLSMCRILKSLAITSSYVLCTAFPMSPSDFSGSDMGVYRLGSELFAELGVE